VRVVEGPAERLGRIAVTVGSFDGVHAGHRAILDRLCKLARAHDARTVVVTFDPHPREFFRPESAPPLLTTPAERERLLARNGVDILVRLRFGSELADTPAEEFVTNILLSMGEVVGIVAGYDFHFGKDRRGDPRVLATLAAERGIAFEEVAPGAVGGTVVKSTRIREAVAAGDLDLARELLGRPYSVGGTVVQGAGRGRGLGFSTANLELANPRKLLPPDGVYAVRVAIEGSNDEGVERFEGVANLGRRPTFGGGDRLLEAHLFDTTRDLYGTDITVEFIARLRPEQKFDGPESLIAQINRDVTAARALLSRTP
jgi:riboflavin kinase / FMN adenylyltransferase